MKKQGMKFVFAASILSGCAGVATVTDSVDYAPDSQARIRLFGQNGKVTVMWRGVDCAVGEKGEKINVGGALGDAFSSLVGTVKNHRIGIAETAMTRRLGEMNGVLSKAFYKEYLLPAGKTVILRAAYLATPHVSAVSVNPQHFAESDKLIDKFRRYRHYKNNGCRAWSFAFIPQAGKDYEVIGFLIPGSGSRSCRVAVNEVDDDGGLVPVKLKVWPPLDKSGRQNMNRICSPDRVKIKDENAENAGRENQAKARA